MKNRVLLLFLWAVSSTSGQFVESEYCIPILGKACRENSTMITNVLFRVLFEDDRRVASVMPDIRSCFRFVGDGSVHFVDLDCKVQRNGLFDTTKPLRRYCCGKVTFWMVGNDHATEADYRGGGRFLSCVEDLSQNGSGALRMSPKVAGLERSAKSWRGKLFLSSGVQRLKPYCDGDTSRIYLKDSFDRNNWFVVSYVLAVEDGCDEKESRRLLFNYDIVRVSEKSLSSVRKGVLPISVRDKSVSQADGVRIAMEEWAEWHYDLEVEFERLGCPIRVLQHDINEAVDMFDCLK